MAGRAALRFLPGRPFVPYSDRGEGPLGLRLRLSDGAILRGLLEDPAGSGGVEMLHVAVDWLFIRGVQRQSRVGDAVPGNLSLQ